jgi:hypothetical protein
MATNRNQRIRCLEATQYRQFLSNAEAASRQGVVEMVTSWAKRGSASDDSSHETRQTIVDRDRCKPESYNRRNYGVVALAHAERYPKYCEAKQGASCITHE